MKLTIQAIIRFEQLNNKPFTDMDYSKEEDIISLFYVCNLSQNPVTLDEFKKGTNEESIKEMIAEFEKETSITSQFKKNIKKQTVELEQEQEILEPIYIKDIVSYLILGGLPADYALNHMLLCDLPLYVEANEKRIKEKLESERLWTYMSLMPHLTKKTKSPTDLYPFPWELDQIKENAAKSIEDDKEIFEAFKKDGKSFFK